MTTFKGREWGDIERCVDCSRSVGDLPQGSFMMIDRGAPNICSRCAVKRSAQGLRGP